MIWHTPHTPARFRNREIVTTQNANGTWDAVRAGHDPENEPSGHGKNRNDAIADLIVNEER